MFARRESLFLFPWLAGALLVLVSLLPFVEESRAIELITAREAGLPEDPTGRSYGISLDRKSVV